MKIENNNKKLLDLWTKCDGETTDASQETKQQEVEGNLDKCHVSKQLLQTNRS